MKAGKITETQCKRSVLKNLPPKGNAVIQGAGIGRDYSAISMGEHQQLVTAMATVSLPTIHGEVYAFWKACNKLETSGGKATAIMVNLLLPARGNENRIKEITRSLSELCMKHQIAYIGGHTELLEELRSPVITVIAYGVRGEKAPAYSVDKVVPGESILMVGTAAMEATAMLVNDKWNELNTRYTTGYLDEASTVGKDLSLHKVMETISQTDVTYVHDMSTGGIFAALWELGEGAGCGIEVFLKDIPIRQETIEVSEFFDINPYMALSGGSALLVTNQGEAVSEQLEKVGISVRMIGQTTDQNDRIVLHDDDTRYLTPPKGDDIYKIYRN